MEGCSHFRETRDCHSLAAQAIQEALDEAVPFWRARSPSCIGRGEGTDSNHVVDESNMGAPRIVGELAKIGIPVTKSTVDKYRVRVRKPPSPTWRAFLKNYAKDIVSIDFLGVPTVRFKILYVLLFLSVDRRRIIHSPVTEHPSAAWTAQQVVEAFPWETAPKYLLRDRDKIYGDWFRRRVKNMGIEEVLTAPHSPWQNPYSERLNGSIRRECLDHVIVFGENHLRRIIADYIAYYTSSRTHLSLEMDSPVTRPVQTPDHGKVISLPQVGGLHHRYERRAA